jgi:hypothetical protein
MVILTIHILINFFSPNNPNHLHYLIQKKDYKVPQYFYILYLNILDQNANLMSNFFIIFLFLFPNHLHWIQNIYLKLKKNKLSFYYFLHKLRFPFYFILFYLIFFFFLILKLIFIKKELIFLSIKKIKSIKNKYFIKKKLINSYGEEKKKLNKKEIFFFINYSLI